MALLLQHLSAFKVLASPAVLQIIKALNNQGFQTLPNPHLKYENENSSSSITDIKIRSPTGEVVTLQARIP